MSLCLACERVVKEGESVKCSTVDCKNVYHFECVGMTRSGFSKLSAKSKSAWRCPDACTRILRDNNSNTPVRLIHQQQSVSGDGPSSSALLDKNVKDYFDNKFASMLECCRNDFQELLLPLRNELRAVSDRINAWEDKLIALEEKISAQDEISLVLQSENSELKDRMHDMVNKLNDIDQASRSCNIELQNIPFNKNENLIKIVQSVGKLVSVDIPSNCIRAVHRVAAAAASQSDRPKNVVLQLTTRRLRDELLHAARVRRTLSTDQIGIQTTPPRRFYVNEHLNLANKILYSKARKTVADKSYKYVWVKNSSIFVRKTDTSKIIRIREDSDLLKIL